jgi:hypothetical protein
MKRKILSVLFFCWLFLWNTEGEVCIPGLQIIYVKEEIKNKQRLLHCIFATDTLCRFHIGRFLIRLYLAPRRIKNA